MSKTDEELVQRHMDTCRHFTGLQNTSCDNERVYKEYYYEKSISCFRGTGRLRGNEKCPDRDFPTREEALAYLDDITRRTNAVIDGKCPDCGAELIDLTIKDGEHKGHGQMVCNACRETKVWI